MITLENLFDFFEFIAEENTYIQHTPGSSGSANRFSRFPIESATGQLSNLGFPRLEVVQLPIGLFNDFDSSQQDVMAVRVRVIYRLPDKHDYNTEVTYLDNSKKALMQMLAYILDAQEDNTASCLLCAFDLSTARYNFIDKATFSGTAVGCELSINFKQYIDWENVTYGDFPQYDGTIALPTTPGSYMLRLLNGVYSWVTASASATWGSITGILSDQTDLQNALNAKQDSLGYTAENSANKTDVMSGNTTSSVKYLSAKGVYDWVISLGYQVALTAANFGAFINGLTGKTTPVDADYLTLMDSEDSNNAKKLSLANLKTTLKIASTTRITIFDDFVGYSGGIGSNGSAGTANTSVHSVAKGAPGTYSKTTDTNHIGILTYTSSSNATGNNYIYMNSWNLGNGEFTMEFMFRIPALAGTKDFVMPMGLVDAVTYAAITNGVYFLYNRSAYGADIQCVCMSGGLTDLQSSGVNITAATWHKYKIVVNAAGTEAKFYINGTLVQTMATYIPTNVLLYSFFGQQITSSSFNICGFDIDYIDYSLTLTTPR